jgi:ABC-type molybdenum transport system ATPase subunit/photorepair protein PhrA
VLFARAIVRSPRMLLLDEPFGSVDAATRAVLAREIRKLVSQGVALVTTAHSAHDWVPYATHELEVVGGHVRYVGVMRTAR